VGEITILIQEVIEYHAKGGRCVGLARSAPLGGLRSRPNYRLGAALGQRLPSRCHPSRTPHPRIMRHISIVWSMPRFYASHARCIIATYDSSELGPHFFINLIQECLPAASSAHRVTRASIAPTFVLGSKDQNEYSPLLYYCRQTSTPSLGTIGELKRLWESTWTW
jgi:hypothetical protein